MKRQFMRVLPIFLAVIMVFSACASKTEITEEKTLYEKIKDTLTTLETYEATATVRYYSNNGSNAYETKQQCKISGEYRVEVLPPSDGAGNVTIFNGKTICQFNSKADGKIAVGTTESAERSEIFLTSFIKNHLASQEVTIAVSSTEDNDKMTFLEAKVPGDNPYLATERLVISNETLLPYELVIYDKDGNERIAVTYHEVKYNAKLDDALFVIDQPAEQ